MGIAMNIRSHGPGGAAAWAAPLASVAALWTAALLLSAARFDERICRFVALDPVFAGESEESELTFS